MKFLYAAVLFAHAILAATKNMESIQETQAMQAEPADTINQVVDLVEQKCEKVPQKCIKAPRKLLSGTVTDPSDPTDLVQYAGCAWQLLRCFVPGVLDGAGVGLDDALRTLLG